MSLSRDDILGVSDITTREENVPEWGDSVFLRALTGDQREAWEASNRIQRGTELIPNPVGARARLLVRSLVDESGNRLFKDQEAGSLGVKSAAVINRLAEIVASMSGISDDAVEDAEGNSPDPSDGSTSISPNDSGTPSQNS